VPESRPRKKPTYTPAQAKSLKAVKGSGRWVAPTMVTLWLVGLAWIVVFYVTINHTVPVITDLGNWNLLVGMGLIGLGFVFATKWE
jgi:hypothetical protein